jgi:serine/threonine-protein kinase
MLYVLASGRQPFYSEHSHELISMQANLVPSPPPGVPAAMSAVIMRLLEKDPAKRYQTADETRQAIDNAVVASRMSTPLALDATLPHGLPALPVPASANATTIDSQAALNRDAPAKAAESSRFSRAPAKAVEPPTPSLAPVPRKRTIWLPLAGLVVIAGAVAFVVLLGPSPPSTPAKPAPIEAPELVPDAQPLAAVDAVVVDAAPVAAVVDAAMVDAPKSTRPSRPTRPTRPTQPTTQTGTGAPVEATVSRPDAAVAPTPIDAAPVAPPDASDGKVKTPW